MMTMRSWQRLAVALALTSTVVVQAAPAIVWSRSHDASSQATHYVSQEVSVSHLLQHADSGGKTAVFVLDRGADGSESLSALAAAGQLPGIQAASATANCMHQAVHTVQAGVGIWRAAAEHKSVLAATTATDFTKWASAPAELEVTASGAVATKRSRALQAADLMVVSLSASQAAQADAQVVAALANAQIDTVILTAVRSTEEVQQERERVAERRRLVQAKAGQRVVNKHHDGRRLEEAAEDAVDLTGVYYVSMTPNILAGILFFFLFITITLIAVSCMGAIQGQDVYVSKMPTNGREA